VSDSCVVILRARFEPSFERFAQDIRLQALEDVSDQVHAIFQASLERLVPVACYVRLFIDNHTAMGSLPSVEVQGVRFAGKALSALDGVHRIFPYIASCGDGMESFDLSRFDMLAPYWVDSLKTQALRQARTALLQHVKEHEGVHRPSSLNPGSGNTDIWPVEQLQGIFRVLGCASEIGVRLTDSSLMVPNKTVAGLLFASKEHDYESCAYCERAHCPNRRVPFERRL